jgi:alkylhydroperoxidase family enzyme
VLRANFFSSEQVAAIVARDYETAGLEPAEMVLMAFADKVVMRAYEVTQEDINELHRHGFSDEEILDIALTAASRSFFSRVVDAVGFQIPPERLKHMQNLMGDEVYQSLRVGRPS